MLMRYHLGLGVGHVYGHSEKPDQLFSESEDTDTLNDKENEVEIDCTTTSDSSSVSGDTLDSLDLRGNSCGEGSDNEEPDRSIDEYELYAME
jgi:hypothetical protein